MEDNTISTNEALNFLTSGGGGKSKPVLKRKDADGETISINSREIIKAFNEALAKIGVNPEDRNVNEVIINAVSGIKRIGY